MTSRMKGDDRAALDRLVDALLEDILLATDNEILAEIEEDGEGPVLQSQMAYSQALQQVGKERLEKAKAEMAASRDRKFKVVDLDPTAARKRLLQILASDPSARLTLAARKAEDLSDADVLGILSDLAELGILNENDPQDD